MTRDLATMAGSGEGLRLCAGCERPCACSASTTCACACGPQCPEAGRRLSSEGDRYPIETAILPLVCAVQALRGCTPCWSCEGHLDAEGGLLRPPQVWFYARSPVYLKLLGDALTALRASGHLAHPWQVRLSYSEGELDPAFSLEPDLARIEAPDLVRLQRDIPVLADALAPAIRQRARALLDSCNERP